MRKLLGLATVLVAVAVFPAAALAVSPHLKGGPGPNPRFTDNADLTLTAGVDYAGLGNFDTLQVVTATANPTADCVNPGSGEHRPPGQNPAEVTVTGTTPVSADDIKNGNVTISTTTSPPTTPVPTDSPEFGCPNKNWTENITDLAFTSATIQVYQDQTAADGQFGRWETLVITVSCTFDPPTSNGTVDPSTYTCTTTTP